MDHTNEQIDSQVNLLAYTTLECSYWLLNRLNIYKYTKSAYMEPYYNYVSTWYKAVPLSAIVLAQSPYPNDIFPHTAAAMSYSSELCIKVMKREVPPTVEVLANDLFINAHLDRDTCISVIRDGWELVDSGILLINESVFCAQGTVNDFIESIDQCSVIVRLLRETEHYGKRTVDIFALGQAGERMASTLTSQFKSNIIRLSKHSVSHPASLSYRFTNLRDPSCHLGEPSFSKLLAKYISNHVARKHTMSPKKSELEIRLQRLSDAARNQGEQATYLINDFTKLRDLQLYIEMNTQVDDDEYKEKLGQLASTLDAVITRLGVFAAVTKGVEMNSTGVAGTVAKPGPSLSTINPSKAAIERHVGKESTLSAPKPMVATKLTLSRAKPANTTAQAITLSPSSVKSSSTTNTSSVAAPIKLNFRKPTTDKQKDSASSVISTLDETTSTADSDKTEEAPIARSALGTKFKKLTLRPSPTPLPSASDKVGSSNTKISSPYSISQDVLNQLSCVEAVVIASGVDVDKNEEARELLDSIQHDISRKTIYNDAVRQLVPCISKDISEIPKFEFANWALNSNSPSATYDKCKELFNF